MAITDPLVISPDVVLIPVADLPEDVQTRFTHRQGDVAITHPRSRMPSQVLDARTAELLEEFRQPRTVVEAVIRFSRPRELDPERTLEEAYPLVARLLKLGFLVCEGDQDAAGIHPLLHPGEEIAGFEILECLHILEDTELYSARGPAGLAALKIEHAVAEASAFNRLLRERDILTLLDGHGAPRLLAAGEVEGRRWLALEWCPGVDAEGAAWEIRRAGPAGRPRLLDLCRAVAAAYLRLHQRGILHGDVHARNLLVDRDGAVRVLDFGYSRQQGAAGDPDRTPRAGVPFFYEPEYAEAVRAGEVLPQTSPAGEQYAVGVLLYRMASGAHYRDFSLERDEMLRQIMEEPPLPFVERGAEAWPELEAVLARALRKEPDERFPSLQELMEALASVELPNPGAEVRGRPAAEALLARVLDLASEGGPWITAGLPAPVASVNFGAAGIACALYRIAMAREDPRLLSLADVWAEKAAAGCGSAEAFYNPEMEVTPETVGVNSAYHTAAGIHAVRARIAHASGLTGVKIMAVNAFLEAARQPCSKQDVTLGRAGLLLAAALLLDLLADSGPAADCRAELKAWGDGQLHSLWSDLDGFSPRRPAEGLNLGAAHGWAGCLYAALCWCRSAGQPPPARVRERLAELADLARPWGRGLRWQWNSGGGVEIGSMPGWCNGSAGFVFLWTLAHRLLGDADYLAQAEGAAWNAWEAPDGSGSLCCGFAGRAYALLNLYRHGGGAEWLQRAGDLAERAAVAVERTSEPLHSLYRGAVGVAVLAADLARPEEAAMPFFEEEGWV
jgi:eukaryotic-like serine/threonine-protein kinase